MTDEFGDDPRAGGGSRCLRFNGLGSGDMSACEGLTRDEREATE